MEAYSGLSLFLQKIEHNSPHHQVSPRNTRAGSEMVWKVASPTEHFLQGKLHRHMQPTERKKQSFSSSQSFPSFKLYKAWKLLHLLVLFWKIVDLLIGQIQKDRVVKPQTQQIYRWAERGHSAGGHVAQQQWRAGWHAWIQRRAAGTSAEEQINSTWNKRAGRLSHFI